MLQQVINGLSIGCIYALLALGYTMVYGVLRMINFAHAELFMAGSMFALGALRYMGVIAGHLNTVTVPLTAAQLAAVLLAIFWLSAAFSGVLGMAIERFVYRRVLRVSAVGVTISALGVSTLLQNAAMLIGKPNIKGFPRLLPVRIFTLMGARFSNMQLVIAGTAGVLLVVLTYLVNRTYMGRCVRAAAEDRDAASLMGVDVNRTVALVFALGSALAAVGGVLYSMYYEYTYYAMGVVVGYKGFSSAVLGGIGSIRGAATGGLILGILETVGAGLLPRVTGGAIGAEWKDVFAFVTLAVVLLFRPQGLFGETSEVAAGTNQP
jgi:branched-chain amino acid transport system permease protein